MGRNDDTKIYYNRETNDVQQEVEGYLTSHMDFWPIGWKQKISKWIMNSDNLDPTDGLHFLIPKATTIKLF